MSKQLHSNIEHDVSEAHAGVANFDGYCWMLALRTWYSLFCALWVLSHLAPAACFRSLLLSAVCVLLCVIFCQMPGWRNGRRYGLKIR